MTSQQSPSVQRVHVGSNGDAAAMGLFSRKVVLPLSVAVVALLAWEAISDSGLISPLLLPAPGAVVRAFAAAPGSYLWHASQTFAAALGGFLLGNILGVLAAMLFVHSRLARNAIYPLAVLAQAIPIVAVVPVIMLWLGSGIEPKIFITSFLMFFPMLVNALRGLNNTTVGMTELFYTLSASGLKQMLSLRLPAAMPYIFAALRLGATAAMVSAVVSEWVASDKGLGYLIVLNSSQYRMADVWVAAALGTAISLAFYGVVVLLERYLAPWVTPSA